MRRVILFILTITFVYSQNCPNSDFSAGNFSNWQGRQGTLNTPATFNFPTAGISVPNYHQVITVPGTDPNTGGVLQLIPPGYTSSARINSQANTNGRASQLSYTMVVDPSNALFVYNYAVVLEDAGHTPNEQPRFEIRVRDNLGNIIGCTVYEVAVGGGVPGFVNGVGAVRWKDWERVGVDLTPYMGLPVTIEAQVAGCVQEQGAHFGYAYLTASCQPLEIQVEYCVGDTDAVLTAPDGFASYSWSTGQTGQVITVMNPNPGDTVQCTITSVTGCVATLNAILNPVTVNASFTFIDNCGTVNFTDNSTITGGATNIINAWDWNFDDAGATSTIQNPTHTYTTNGTYDVQFIAESNIGCIDTVVVSVPVAGFPTANFSIPTGCGLSNEFQDSSSVGGSSAITSYAWDFGDASTGAGTPISHTYAVSGTYDIQLVVTNADGCTDTLIRTFTNRSIPVADFNFNNECVSQISNFTDASTVANATITNWDWSFDDGLGTSTIEDPTYTYTNSGTYDVQLIVTSNEGCIDTIIQTVTSYPLPDPNFTVNEPCLGDGSVFANTSSISSGAIVIYSWDFNAPGVPNSSLVNPQVAFATSDSFNVQLIATSNFGCQDSITRLAIVRPMPIPDFVAGPLEGCFPFSTTMDNLTTIEYGSILYSWDLGAGQTSTAFEPSASYPNVDAQYTIIMSAVSNFGCDTSITKPNYITVHRKPNASFTYQPTDLTVIDSDVQCVNLSTGADNYLWNFGTGDMSTAVNPAYRYDVMDSATFVITLIASTTYGCTDTADAIVHIKPDYAVFIPNTFTPDGDGMNENFTVGGFGLVDIEMLIFNRWGDNIFRQTGLLPMTKGWDGTHKNTDCQQDVYGYKIIVTNVLGDTYEYYGNINLLR